ncbi:PD-(D/E)XK nuclease family protein, partial [Candidatus Woesebacteria bacterium]|nr:PD-(D/E)XK nuclease family protein [Candidatus Woesebacteria bacterium]
ILYTKNKYAADIIPLLEKWNIPFYLEGGMDALIQPIVQQFVTLCTVIVGLRQGNISSEQLFEICSYTWLGVDRVTLFQLGRLAGKERRPLLEVLYLPTAELVTALQNSVEAVHLERIQALLQQLESWAALDYEVVFTTWLETIVAESGLHHFLIAQAEQEIEPLLAVYSLFAFVKQLNTSNHHFHLSDFVRSVETLREQRVKIPLQSLSSTEDRVRLSTVHKAKGQEWSHVFLLHLIDGVWGNRRSLAALPVPENIVETASALARLSKEEQNQDDRRLLYVAMTRAKQSLEMWYPEQSEQDGVLRQRVPSMFISELSHRPEIARVNAETAAPPVELAATLIGPRPHAIESDRLEAYLKQLVEDFPLSITALNNYLRDPTIFFYQNLLSLPSAKLPHLAFGTAIHSALELLGSEQIRGKAGVTEEQLFHHFDRQLQRELLTDDERVRRSKRGHAVLRAYANLQDFSAFSIWKTEYKVGYGANAAFLDNIRLTGRIDRLDWNDATHKTVRVIDYKTGKPRTKNEITASTETALKALSEREKLLPESIRGSYVRQLLFYRLLGQLDHSFTPEITLGTFDFIEAAVDKEKLIQHTFSLEDGAVKELEAVIRQAMIEIRSLSFLSSIPDLSV